MDKMRIDVKFCAACGGDHMGLVFLLVPSISLDYRAQCPTNGVMIYARVKPIRDPRLTNGAGPRETKPI